MVTSSEPDAISIKLESEALATGENKVWKIKKKRPADAGILKCFIKKPLKSKRIM